MEAAAAASPRVSLNLLGFMKVLSLRVYCCTHRPDPISLMPFSHLICDRRSHDGNNPRAVS